MKNSKLKRSKFKIVMLAMSVIMIISLYQLYFNQSLDSQVNVGFVESENLPMDYTVYPSTIPENKLLRIHEAEELYRSSFEDGKFFGVTNPEKLVKLVKHAWQWDKNAMPYYYRIVFMADSYDEKGKEYDIVMMSFNEFMQKYRDQLVDNAGNPLSEPDIFKSIKIRDYLWDKFADLKYSYFSFQNGWVIGTCGYDKQGIARPCPDEKLEKSIEYLNYAIEGGYHCYEALTARMLFQQGRQYKDQKYKQLNKLTEYRRSLKSDDLKQAIDYAQLMAEHSSIIGILRMTEAYLYGLGREQDPVKAFAWSRLSGYAKQKIIEIDNNLAWDAEQLPPVWEYNKEIQNRLEQQLTPAEKQVAFDYLETLKTKVVTWDYNEWRDQIDDFHPKP
ncbi:hypothetical protein [Gilliamella sp. CG25]|uniref:hypothetical protein n=1 Tax=unclassified Gilliamella TaxID=2685620 RepID=UPI0039870395